jgi:hypothetical protein
LPQQKKELNTKKSGILFFWMLTGLQVFENQMAYKKM